MMLTATQFIGFGAGQAVKPVSLTFINSTKGEGGPGVYKTVTLPSGIQNGDFGIIVAAGNGLMDENPPSGWTRRYGGLQVGDLVTKTLAAADSSATVSWQGSVDAINWGAVGLIFRPDVSISAVRTMGDTSSWNREQTSGNPALQSITVAGEPGPIIIIGGAYISSGPLPSQPRHQLLTGRLRQTTRIFWQDTGYIMYPHKTTQ